MSVQGTASILTASMQRYRFFFFATEFCEILYDHSNLM